MHNLGVRVTVSSSDGSAEIVHLLHGIAGGWPDRHRLQMTLISTTGGPGAYTRVFGSRFVARLPVWAAFAARFNAVVDVVSRGSIYSMSDPFTNEFWGLPYIARAGRR